MNARQQAAEESPDSRAVVDRVLRALGRQVGKDLGLDEKGNCILELEDKVGIAIEVAEESDCALIYTAIAPLPEEFEPRYFLLKDMLARNVAQQMRGGGTIGLDQDGGVLVYAIAQKTDLLNTASLEAMLETAFTTTIAVRQEIGFDPDKLTESSRRDEEYEEEEDAESYLKI